LADVDQQSDVGYHMAKSLAAQGIDVTRFWLSSPRWLLAHSAVMKAAYALPRRTYIGKKSSARLNSFARESARLVRDGRFDVVLTPSAGGTPVARLECEQPIVLWTDTTATGLVGFYPNFSRLASSTARDLLAADRSVLERCVLAVFSSRWAADVAVHSCDIDPAKVRVVPFGANMESVHDQDEIRRVISRRDRETCRVAFVGTDWKRKGGPFALDVLEELRAGGMKSALTANT
jgi:hypothetical protein